MVRICGVAFDSNLGLTANFSAALKSQSFAPFFPLFKIVLTILTVYNILTSSRENGMLSKETAPCLRKRRGVDFPGF